MTEAARAPRVAPDDAPAVMEGPSEAANARAEAADTHGDGSGLVQTQPARAQPGGASAAAIWLLLWALAGLGAERASRLHLGA